MESLALSTPKLVTLKDVRNNPKVRKLIEGANEVMKAMGYTEHGHRHAGVVSSITRYILDNVGVPDRENDLGQIAAYLHDIGNVINLRRHHRLLHSRRDGNGRHRDRSDPGRDRKP